MLLLPEPLPDETFYSLLARIAMINGSSNHVEVVRILLGEMRATSVIGAKVNLRHFCELTQNQYGSPPALLQTFCALVVKAHLGELDGSTLDEIERGVLLPTLSDMMFGVSRSWKVCPRCIEYDVRTYGIAYWHRSHQLPTSYYCLEHGLALEEWRLGRARLHNNFFLPHELDNTQRIDVCVPPGEKKVWLDITLLGINALADAAKPLSQIVIKQALLSGLRDRGVLSRFGQMRMFFFKEGFEREYCSVASGEAPLTIGQVSDPKQLLFGITDGRPCKPFGRLLLVQWLFGSWDAFKERCKWQDVFNTALRHRSEGEGESLQSDQNFPEAVFATERYRQACMDYKASYTNPTRLEFLKVSYRAFRWLRQNDQAWLDKQLPLPPRRDGQFKLFE